MRCFKPIKDSFSLAPVQNNAFFEHLQAFSTIRKRFDEIYSAEGEDLRKELEMFDAKNKFKAKGGRNPAMRQHARDPTNKNIMSTDKFISVCFPSLACSHS